ncbi:MAG: DUF6259 domain-containing protein, partial [Firmicutes bacterium]|nr:DUF6259 domain-containing protein [Bacillota bacterium]
LVLMVGIVIDDAIVVLENIFRFVEEKKLTPIEAARKGIEAVHRRGGRVIYYVEGLIVWKGSRLGLSKGGEWALQEPDGSYTEHYKGYWHMCPACEGWQDWLAETCAAMVKTLGVDGFFIDSLCATYNHRCYNPGHRHPHPDVWNWGIRRLFAKIRAAVDKVNPETILFTEGCADLAREFVDGFIVHSHDWTGFTFLLSFLRYLHPEIRAYESWARSAIAPPMPLAELHVRNFVNGLRIYAHEPDHEEMAELARRARRYHDSYPEICDCPISEREVAAENCLAELFIGRSAHVLTVGNPTGERVEAGLALPGVTGRQPQPPGYHATPVVPHDLRPVDTEMVEQAENV